MKKFIVLAIFLFAIVLLTPHARSVESQSNPEFPNMNVRVFIDGGDWAKEIEPLLQMGLDIIDGKKSALGGYLDILLNKEELNEVKSLGYRTEILIPDLTAHHQSLGGGILARDFGPYYTYAEMVTEINRIASFYPGIVRIDSIGTSLEGRTIWAVKVSDNPMIEEGEPEVLFDGVHHAREPITCSVMIDLLNTLTENYGVDPRITYIVDNRETWIIPVLNPDGYVFNETFSSGMWRKNRRDNGGGSFGVDPNRNYGYLWGYDNIGSSPIPDDPTYRGTGPFSEPETQAMRDLVTAHEFVIALNYHSHSNYLLIPWGYEDIYTPEDTMYRDLSADMTKSSCYKYGTTWELLYNTNGDADDWMYGDSTKPRIFAYIPEVGEWFWQPDTCIIENQIRENHWMNIFSALASGLYFLPDNYTLDDTGGNNNGQLDPGETIDLTLFLKNISPIYNATGVEVLLTTCDSYTELQSRQASLGNMSAREIKDNGSNPFILSVDSLTPQGHQIDFTLTISAIGDSFSVEEPFSIIVGQLPTLFFDDFDTGTGNWTWQSPWNTTTSSSNSSPNSATDSPGGNYENNLDISLMKNSGLDLTSASYAELQFYHRYFIEEGYDFGFVEISTDGGGCWKQIACFSGTLPNWSLVSLPITEFIGYSDVNVRFRLETDPGIREDGWYIDDVEIVAKYWTNNPPSSPTLNFPPNDTTLLILTPDLVVNNSTDPEGDTLTYGFRVYTDSLFTQLVASVDGIPEGASTTSWTVTPPLFQNTQYWWRAYAEDSETRSRCMMEPATFYIGNIVGTEEKRSEYRTPNIEFRLFKNHPNPFHSSTLIRYSIPSSSPASRIPHASPSGGHHVSLNIYDITGRLIETLVDEVQEPGVYQVEWDSSPNQVASGIYFYRLTSGDFTSTRKLVLLR
jgi:hypothetical protein